MDLTHICESKSKALHILRKNPLDHTSQIALKETALGPQIRRAWEERTLTLGLVVHTPGARHRLYDQSASPKRAHKAGWPGSPGNSTLGRGLSLHFALWRLGSEVNNCCSQRPRKVHGTRSFCFHGTCPLLCVLQLSMSMSNQLSKDDKTKFCAFLYPPPVVHLVGA